MFRSAEIKTGDISKRIRIFLEKRDIRKIKNIVSIVLGELKEVKILFYTSQRINLIGCY